MRQIKAIPGTPLAIYEVSKKAKWLAPEIIEVGTEVYQLEAPAVESVAGYSGLAKAISARSIFNKSPYKWGLFTEVFMTNERTHYCLINTNTNVIHFFLSTIEELDELIDYYSRLNEAGVEITLNHVDGEDCLISIEQISDDLASYTMFSINKKELLNVLYKIKDDRLSIVIPYNNKLVTKKTMFTALALDYDNYLFELEEERNFGRFIDPNFNFSLKEMILFLRVIQGTRYLPLDEGSFVERIAELLANPDDRIVSVAASFYRKLHRYVFYYDNKKRIIVDETLVADTLKTAKPHLYFHTGISFANLEFLLTSLIKKEFEAVYELRGIATYDVYYLNTLFLLFKSIIEPADSAFDYYRIPNFFTEED